MKSKNKLINKYLKLAKSNCPYVLRKLLDRELKNDLIDFCNSKNDITMKIIEDKFGKPEQYAMEYISLCDDNVLKKRLNHSKKVKTIAFVVAIIVLIITITTVLTVIKWNEQSEPEYIYSEVSEEKIYE